MPQKSNKKYILNSIVRTLWRDKNLFCFSQFAVRNQFSINDRSSLLRPVDSSTVGRLLHRPHFVVVVDEHLAGSLQYQWWNEITTIPAFLYLRSCAKDFRTESSTGSLRCEREETPSRARMTRREMQARAARNWTKIKSDYNSVKWGKIPPWWGRHYTGGLF